MPYSDAAAPLPCAGLTRDSAIDDLYKAGLAYSTGLGVDTDLIAAHKWFNLAAAKGHESAKTCRQEMADMMSSEDIKRAQRAAREWLQLMN